MESKATRFFRKAFKIIRNLLIAAIATVIVEQILLWICELGSEVLFSTIDENRELMEAISGHNDIMGRIIGIPYTIKFLFGVFAMPLAYIGMVATPIVALCLAFVFASDE